MVRSHKDEIAHRYKLRKKYLEDPNYRKWSDIAPDDGRLTNHFINEFAEVRDDVLFCHLITNQSYGQTKISQVIECLNKGQELPINWENFYAYFDERLNDPQNRYLSYLTDPIIFGDYYEPSTSVEKLLNQYRDSLLSTYDMI